jgi:hypothetical protein
MPTSTPAPEPAPESTPGVPFAAYIPHHDVKSYKHLLVVSYRLMSENKDVVIAVTVEGEVEDGDRLTCRQTIDFGGFTITGDKVVIIRERAWLDLGEGWAAVTPEDSDVAEVLDFCAGSSVFWESFDFSNMKGLEGRPEEINGVPSTRIDLAEVSESLAYYGITPFLWAGADVQQMVFWLAQDGGWIVKVSARFSGNAETMELTDAGFDKEQEVVAELHIELSEVNDPAIRVSAPLP